MEFKKRYNIFKWTDWSNIVAEAIDDFITEYSLAPIVLIASTHTYDQIEYVINIMPGQHEYAFSLLEDGTLEPVSEDEHIQINQYRANDVVLDFAKDDSLDGGAFVLYYADDPDWGDDDEVDEPEVDLGVKVEVV